MKARLIGWIVIVVAALAVVSTQAQDTDTKEAYGAVAGWLTLIDHGELSASWGFTASMLRQTVDEPTWVKAVGAVHERMGQLKQRRSEAPRRRVLCLAVRMATT